MFPLGCISSLCSSATVYVERGCKKRKADRFFRALSASSCRPWLSRRVMGVRCVKWNGYFGGNGPQVVESILLLTAVSGGSGRRDGPFRSVVELETISAGPRPSSVDIRHVLLSAPTWTCQCARRFSPPPCRLLFRLSLHRSCHDLLSPFNSRERVLAQRQGVSLVSRRTSVRICFGSPFSSERLWFVDTVL